ncbi:MAG: MBOAT family O-acyltransferase [Myxococcota bacterium]|nr:MBOAT family O-acyltransferase [Myxococcota bacterium]
MLFPTLDYLIFLLVVVAAYWSAPQRYRLMVLGVASLVFYASWDLTYLPALLLVSGVAWLAGRLFAAGRAQGVGTAALLGILFTPLFIFKYWDWLAWNVEEILGWVGIPLALPSVGLVLPVGISFFTFQAVAYTVDARRGGPVEPGLGRLVTFLAFFPQLVAGPIVRAPELLPQLKTLPLLKGGMVGEGLFRITKGMLKKLLIADVIKAAMVDPVFAEPELYGGLEVLIALYAYTLQIYYDFSAYTDIAIGSALLFGLRLPENFRRPYQATSVAEFWRRWHITLSNWVRDYIYYPMGGSKTDAEWKVYRNILLTLVTIGLWHGASWNFVIYGVLHGTAVGLNRWQRQRTGRRPGEPVPGGWWGWLWRFLITFHFVVLCRILFRTEALSGAAVICTRLLDMELLLPRFSPLTWGLLLLGYGIHFTPTRWVDSLQVWFTQRHPALQALIAALVAAACWQMGTRDQLAFIYYRF